MKRVMSEEEEEEMGGMKGREVRIPKTMERRSLVRESG